MDENIKSLLEDIKDRQTIIEDRLYDFSQRIAKLETQFKVFFSILTVGMSGLLVKFFILGG